METLFPTNIRELFVLLFSLISYGTLGYYIAENYRIIYDNRVPWDAYFSFDNQSIVLTGGGFEKHPLANYFFDIIRDISSWFSGGNTNTEFRISLSMMSNIAVSFSMLYIFKYLSKIINLPFYLAFILVIFTGFFSTSILLSFTPETYTYSLFLLTSFHYFVAKKIQAKEKLSALSLMLFGVSTGGMTITNIVKIYIPILLERGIFGSFKKFLNATIRVGISCIVFILLYLNRLDFDYSKILNKTTEQYERFSQPKVVPIWDMITSWFFGGNVIFSSYIIRDYHNKKGFEYKALFMDTFSSVGQYSFVIILLGLVLWSILRNIKNPLVSILSLSFLVDIVIHCVMKFGLHTSYIYGGHFVFVYPLLLGWLFHTYRKHKKTYPIILFIFIGLLCFAIINNSIRMEEFFQFSEKYHK